MTLQLADRSLLFDGQPVLTDIASELVGLAEFTQNGVFLKVSMPQTATRFHVSLGKLPELAGFVVCHRFEPYWMKPAVGSDLAQVPPETQFFLGHVGGVGWLLLVPLVDDPLRFSLRGTKSGSLELLAETADAKLPAQAGLAVYAAVAPDPFAMMSACATEVCERLGLGKLRQNKPLPKFVDQFGWCTWDAFYADVSAQKVREGLAQFQAAGVAPKLLILDDGWLDIKRMPTGERRLVSFEANEKFEGGLKPFAKLVKQEFAVETLLVWHTIVGYWGGVDSSMGYGATDQVRHFGEGIMAHAPTFNNDWWGELVGYIPTEHIARFYDDFHGRLAEQGVDGVKVDSQALLEAVAQGQGGRVGVSLAYRQALESSVQRHFEGRLINCMSNAQETWYYSPDSTLLRSSIDYFPNSPDSHGLHLYTNALVGLWFGQFMHPDWDMFQSGHPMGAFHAAGRAVSGGPVYVSDKLGEHDFELLKKLMCSDGQVLRADQPGLPTLDCLLVDPSKQKVLLKIWNRNRGSAIVGAFNCYYAADACGGAPVKGQLAPSDVPGLVGDDFAVFAQQAQTLGRYEREQSSSMTLRPSEFELFSIVPIAHGFAAIGLADKFNSRAAIASEPVLAPDHAEVELKDGGAFLAYAERSPKVMELDGQPIEFTYTAQDKALRTTLAGPGSHKLTLRW